MEILTLLGIFHVIVALLLIVLVLLQDPKGGGAAGMFGGGGSQNSFFGATGAGNFLTTLTKWAAVIFAISSIVMTMQTSHSDKSVMDSFVPEAAAPASDMDTAPATASEEKATAPTNSDETNAE